MCAGVAELVDALGLGPSAYGVGVRVPSPVPPFLLEHFNCLLWRDMDFGPLDEGV